MSEPFVAPDFHPDDAPPSPSPPAPPDPAQAIAATQQQLNEMIAAETAKIDAYLKQSMTNIQQMISDGLSKVSTGQPFRPSA